MTKQNGLILTEIFSKKNFSGIKHQEKNWRSKDSQKLTNENSEMKNFNGYTIWITGVNKVTAGFLSLTLLIKKLM